MSTAPRSDPAPAAENWLSELYRRAGLAGDSPLTEIARRTDELAVEVAPVARTWWKWLILIQGLSVAAPLLWLLRDPLHSTPPLAAFTSLLAVLIMVGALWWVRWRGMQHTWARARLVAEVARSRLAAAVCPKPLSLHALDAVPEVRGLPAAPVPAEPPSWPQWKDAWVSKRVDDQLDFYRQARDRALKARRNSSRWTTLLMDVSLSLAVAGVIIALFWQPIYMRVYRIELVLGVLGAILPLGIILQQSLRHFQELRRRTAGFTTQINMLELAKQQLNDAPTGDAALEIVAATEDKLLAEVVDWYFETETAEQFFRVREVAQRSAAALNRPASTPLWLRPVTWVLAIGGVGLLFLGRVILGRIGWVVVAVAISLGWLNYAAPTDPQFRSRLRVEATLTGENGEPWQPVADRAAIGCIVIAHGLHDGAILTKDGDEARWMQRMAREFHKPLDPLLPNIALVDWEGAAQPSKIHEIATGSEVGDLVLDVAGIRTKAGEVGDFLALRLYQSIRDGQIRPDRPLHLIGHSAGGFLVARAALDLIEWHVIPASKVSVTILDTPGADAEITARLPALCPVDFYVTSGFVTGLDEKTAPAGQPGLHVQRISAPGNPLTKEAHRYVCRWYTDSIAEAVKGSAGFGRSPFCSRNP